MCAFGDPRALLNSLHIYVRIPNMVSSWEKHSSCENVLHVHHHHAYVHGCARLRLQCAIGSHDLRLLIPCHACAMYTYTLFQLRVFHFFFPRSDSCPFPAPVNAHPDTTLWLLLLVLLSHPCLNHHVHHNYNNCISQNIMDQVRTRILGTAS